MSTRTLKNTLYGVILCVLNIIYLVGSYSLPWSYDTVPLWADFGTSNASLLTDYQSQFAATHFDIISVEKCLGHYTQTPTEESFYKIASNMRQYASSNESKILFYWNIGLCYCDCYDITKAVLNNQSMWFHDDNGNPVMSGNERPFYDMTQPYVRDWWVNALITIINNALRQNIMVDGVFADGACENIAGFPNVSQSRGNEYNQGIVLLMDETKKAFSQINDDLFILANGIHFYAFMPDHCTHIIPHVDGVLVEHFGAFEQLNNAGTSKENGTINATVLLELYNISQSMKNGDYGDDKFMVIKAWIGPETTPKNALGPTWPPQYGETPSNHSGIQNASTQLISFPLATYLCGMYNENVYFNYAWYWDVGDNVPCPDDVESCNVPSHWYTEFKNKLGKSVSNGILYDTYKCNRSFEHANVYVDLNDDSSAVIQWV